MDRSNNGSAIWGYQQIAGYVGGALMQGHQYEPANATENSDQGTLEDRPRTWHPMPIPRACRPRWDLSFDVGIGELRWVNNITDFDGSQNYDPDYSDGGDTENAGFTGWVSSQDTMSQRAATGVERRW